MNKYSDIEIQTAKNLLKEGYKWIRKSRLGAILAYGNKPTKNPERFIPGKTVCADYVPIFTSIKFGDDPTSLEAVAHPQILDDVEKRYLSAVIRPFRDEVKCIAKAESDLEGMRGFTGYYLYIRFNDANVDMNLPVFYDSNMYKGMEKYKNYSLKDLGL